ncbi:hypothetical protein JST97_28285 [bacterium]|nr:hypothetical protein [bacterium]
MNYHPGFALYQEVLRTPGHWREFLDLARRRQHEFRSWLQGERFGQVVFLGCGPQIGVAQSAAALTQPLARINTRSATPQDILFSELPPYDPRIKTLVVMLSRGGWSGSGLRALRLLRARDPRAVTLAITNQEGKISTECDRSICTSAYPDLSLSGVQANSLAILACWQLALWLSRRPEEPPALEPLGGESLTTVWARVRAWLRPSRPPRNLYLVSSTPIQGLAQSHGASCSTLSGIPTHASLYSGLALSTLPAHSAVVGLTCPSFLKAELAALERLPNSVRSASLGGEEQAAKVPILCPLENLADFNWALLAPPVITLLALACALQSGRNPDFRGAGQ